MSLIFNQVGAVPSEDVDLHINMNLFKLASTAEDRKYYSEKIAQESMVSVDIYIPGNSVIIIQWVLNLTACVYLAITR